MEHEKSILGILEKSFANTMAELEEIMSTRDFNKVDEVKLYLMEMYELITNFESALEEAIVFQVDTK